MDGLGKRKRKHSGVNFNDLMHETNFYRENPQDFIALAQEFPELSQLYIILVVLLNYDVQ